jgi:hypothetical protein
MILVKTIEQFKENSIFFCDPIKNNVMNEGNFIRILYSTNDIILNGIYFLITLNEINCEKYFNKFKCNFNIELNKYIIDCIKIIEEKLLKKYKINKNPNFKIYEQLKNGNIKIFNDLGNKPFQNFILKISGIWETNMNYGLTFKFII